MQQHRDVVGGAPDVDRDDVRAERLGDRDGGQRVLAADARGTAGGDDPRRTRSGPPGRSGGRALERRHHSMVGGPPQRHVTER
ncbi:hypothetical protein [Curtobacterium sp. MCJR17_043]|uniref:hypothetical protein n=1 Tax=Curtobacterium sp. MCJR17_043 TaxID=2175660 RepID=UPI0024DF6788|nr:hypothetical protein [Curtobacterium sp. MCJR17_043]WIB36759.1 hypothetical protein DEJ15_06940 [Curtobacterium sp. MCJR17_043]